MALLTCLTLVLALLLGPVSPVRAVSEGDLVPAVSLAGLATEPVELSSLRSRVVVVDFWATWCAPCEGQLRRLKALAEEFPPEDLTVVTVSIDAAAEAPRNFLARRFPKARFYSAHDPGGAVLSSFGAEGVPALYVIDAAGVVRQRHFGPGGLQNLSSQVGRLVSEARLSRSERLASRGSGLSNLPSAP